MVEVFLISLFLLAVGGLIFPLFGFLFDILYGVVIAICWLLKQSGKGVSWALNSTMNALDGYFVRKLYEHDKEVKKGKRLKSFKIADKGDIFDEADDFSDFD